MTDVVFAPSEIALLFGDRFAAARGLLGRRERLLRTGAEVAANPLAAAILEVALLSLERSGFLRLEVRERDAMFGLVRRTVVDAEVLRADFPALGLLERHLLGAARRAPADVGEVVHAFLDRDLPWPQGEALDMVKAGMHARGLLEVERETTLLVFATTRYRLAGPAAHAAAAASPDAVLRLLEGAGERPRLRAVLRKQIAAAFTRRTESDG